MQSARLLLAVPFLAVCLNSQTKTPSYGPMFLWGTAMSAHQVEGKKGGGQFSDWYVFEHTPGNIANGDTADTATDHWDRYPEDLQLAANLGTNTLRISIAWEKVEPSRRQFNSDVIKHYQDELTAMKGKGLRPMVTLMHGTTPIWFGEKGGWLAPDSPDEYAAYAAYVVYNLADLCDLWVTINEPLVLVGDGYLTGKAPPQIQSPVAAIQAAFNLVRAHRLATAAIHKIQPVRADGSTLRGVGLVNGLDIFDPYDPNNILDVITAELVNQFSNWAIPEAAVYGTFNGGMFPAALTALGYTVDKSQMQDLVQNLNAGIDGNPTLDWIGVNYYTRTLVQFNPGGLPNFIPPPGAPTGDDGRPIYPPGTERMLRETADHFPSIPLAMTENGVADKGGTTTPGKDDALRQEFIKESLAYLDRARFGHDGLPPIDVRGYYHWSLTDNFEWQSGYAIRLGLVMIDYKNNLERINRHSFEVYRQAIQDRK